MSCQITFPSVDVLIPGGSLTPTSLIVRGLVSCQNALATSVTISTNVTGPAVTITPDPTGAFSTTLPITVTVQCGKKINVTITGKCADGSTCSYSDVVTIDCGSCARAQLNVTQAPCVAGVQPVTLNADISIPAGATYQFQWQTGLTSAPLSGVFPISNVGGTQSTIHSAPPATFSYPPGAYTAKLVQVSPSPGECPLLEISFVAQCITCPTVTGAVVVGQCDSNGHRPVTYTLTFVPQIPQGATASAVISYGGLNTAGATFAPVAINTVAGSVSFVTHATTLPPSATPFYSTATVNVTHQGQSCPQATVPFNSAPGGTPPGVVVDTCLPCPTSVSVTITTPATNWCVPAGGNSATGVATLRADVVWPAGTTQPPLPSKFDWTVTLPNAAIATRNNEPPQANGSCIVDTASGWGGNGSINGAINLNQVGPYLVSVVAKFPPSAGLPTNADGTPACNLTGPSSFALSACAPTIVPTCPSIQITATNADCVDGSTGKVATIMFAAAIVDPAGLSSGIQWNFGDPASGALNTDTTPAGVTTVSHPYSTAGSFLVTAKVVHSGPCVQNIGSDTAALTLTVTVCPCPAGMVRNASGACVLAPCPPGTVRNASGACVPVTPGPSIGCIILLILALVFLFLGAVLIAVSQCAPLAPQVAAVMLIVGIVCALLGLVLLVIWGISCARFMCRILNILAWVFSFLTAFSVAAAAILFFLSQLACAGGLGIDAIEWGVAAAIVGWISGITRCPIFVTPL